MHDSTATAPATIPAAAGSRARVPAVVGLVVMSIGSIGIAALDITTALETPARLRRTISEYGLGPQQWVFAIGTLVLAAGSLITLVAGLRRGLVRPWSAGAIALGLWAAGLTLLVAAPKQNWAVDPSIGLSGALHWIGTTVAFVSLPVAVLTIARPLRVVTSWARGASVAALAAVASLLPVLYALVVGALGTTPWYRLITLGYVERAIVVAEVVALLCLGVALLRSRSGIPTVR